MGLGFLGLRVSGSRVWGFTRLGFRGLEEGLGGCRALQ